MPRLYSISFMTQCVIVATMGAASAQTTSSDEILQKLRSFQPSVPSETTPVTRSFQRSIDVNQQISLGSSRPAQPKVYETPPAAPGRVDLNINFKVNSAELSNNAQNQLFELGKALNHQDLVNKRIMIAGHTDASGSDAYNLQLSQRRAESVRQYLWQFMNVEPSRIQTVGHGERSLKNRFNPTSAENRRVEIINLDQ